MIPDAELLIIFDGCFSGGWVQENIENNDKDLYGIYIQSSCSILEESIDDEKIGGYLIHNLTELNISGKGSIKSTSRLSPKFNGDWFNIIMNFKLLCMYSKWEDFKKIIIYEYLHGRYIGEYANNCPEGKGIYFNYSNRSQYQGEFQNGKREGFGKY